MNKSPVIYLLFLLSGIFSVGCFAEESDMVEPLMMPPPVPGSSTAMRSTSSSSTSPSPMTATPYEITVLFLYTPDDVRLYGSVAAVSARIDQLIAFANSVYTNSGVDLNIVKAGQDLVYYDNSNTTVTAFNHLAYKTHIAFADVNRRRVQTQADFVVLLRPRKLDTAVCGKAFFTGNVANPATDYWTLGGYAYAHIYINCYDFVLAHELGHIMGLVHARDATGGEPTAGKAYAYGAGYKVANDFNTIMATTVGYATFPCCQYLPVFASPAATCIGKSGVPKPCGVDSNLSNGADAVLAINNIASQLPKFSDDSDADGMPDWFEHFWGLDRFDAADATGDADGDGLVNLSEYYLETYAKPITGLANTSDTDGDGLLDGNDPLPTINGNPVFDLNGFFTGGGIREQVYP